MNNIHVENHGETPSTKQAKKEQVWEQMDLFDWAKLCDESCVGFAVRNGL